MIADAGKRSRILPFQSLVPKGQGQDMAVRKTSLAGPLPEPSDLITNDGLFRKLLKFLDNAHV